MRVFVAGASGVIGTQLVPLLSSVGHDVTGLTRSSSRSQVLTRCGANAVVADALDSSALTRAVHEAAPDAVVNLLTAIPGQINPRRMARQFEMTNRLRTQGTRNLLDAAKGVGVKRVLCEGLAFAYDPDGERPANEDVPFWPRPPKQFASVLDALQQMEELTAQADGVVLRFGHLYGPGSVFAPDGSFVQQVLAGKVPLIAGGSSIFSFTHAHDAATAILAALDSEAMGALNIVDDDPAPMSDWLPELARLLGARPPKNAPAALARIAIGGWGIAFMTRLRGADNARARLALDWRPRFTSWRAGFAAELGGRHVGAA